MSEAIVISHDARRVGLELEGMRARMSRSIEEGALSAAEHCSNVLRRVTRRLHPKGSGKLANSFTPSVTKRSGKVRAGAFSSEPHANVRNEGVPGKAWDGTPKNVSKLAIPIFGTVGRPRDYDLKVIPRPGKNTLLATVVNGELQTPMFVLVDRVIQAGSGYLRVARDEAKEGVLEALMRATIRSLKR